MPWSATLANSWPDSTTNGGALRPRSFHIRRVLLLLVAALAVVYFLAPILPRYQFQAFYGSASPALESWHILQPHPTDPDYPSRDSDVTDTFGTYARASEWCGLNALDLHTPISPLCSSRSAVLDAMSSGGRPGVDAPYIPRGCDMHWYSTSEICHILNRFSHVYVVGDSLQRMLNTAFYVLLREDLGLGGVAEWDFDAAAYNTTTTLEGCKCENQFKLHECSHSFVRSYSDAVKRSAAHNTPACARYLGVDAVDFELSYHEWQGSPPSEKEKADLVSSLPHPTMAEPEKPIAFVLHHTFWSGANITNTLTWLDSLQDLLTSSLPWLASFPLEKQPPWLFTTANAPGIGHEFYLKEHTSQAVAAFELEIGPFLEGRDIDMLGFYNATVQVSSNDAVHAGMRGNLLKAMMVLNWLDWVGRGS